MSTLKNALIGAFAAALVKLCMSHGVFHHHEPWAEFSTKDQIVTVETPGTPKADSSDPTISQLGGEMYVLDDYEHAYTIGYMKIPKAYLDSASDETIIDNARDDGIKNVKGTLVSEESSPFHGYKGRAIVMSVQSGSKKVMGFARIWIARPYLIMTIVVVDSESETPDADTTRFFNSTKLSIPDEG